VSSGSSDTPTAAVVPFLDPEDELLATLATAAGAMAVVISPAGVSWRRAGTDRI
jgi:hypothetical protein